MQQPQQQQQSQHQEAAQFQHLSENERRFIEFYTNMSSQQPHDSGKDFMELPCHSQLSQRPVESNKHHHHQQQQQQQDMQTMQGAFNQAGGASPAGMTIVTPTQATVQQARKQVMRRAAVKVKRARKVLPRKKAMSSKRKSKAPARRKKTTGQARRAKVQKKRAQRGAGRKRNTISTKKSSKKAR